MSTRFGSNTDSPLVQADFDNVASAAIDAGKSLPQMLIDVSKRFGSRPAFSNMGRTLSYAEFDALTRCFAAWLQSLPEVSPGDRVAIMPGFADPTSEETLSGNIHLARDYGIFGETRNGGCAEYMDAPAVNLLPIPDAMSFTDAAACPLVFLTA